MKLLGGLVLPFVFCFACDGPLPSSQSQGQAGGAAGGGESGEAAAGDGAETRPGTVQLLLTDAPPDLNALSSVTVTLRKVAVHVAPTGEGGARAGAADGWQTVREAPATFDLMTLRNDVTATLGELRLPQGKITQIRLLVDPAGQNEVLRKDGRTCPLDLRAVDQTGVKINHPFKAIPVAPCQTVDLTVDFDLNESLEEDDGCSYKLKPVIKLKRVRTRGEACAGSDGGAAPGDAPRDGGAAPGDASRDGGATPDGGTTDPGVDPSTPS